MRVQQWGNREQT